MSDDPMVFNDGPSISLDGAAPNTHRWGPSREQWAPAPNWTERGANRPALRGLPDRWPLFVKVGVALIAAACIAAATATVVFTVLTLRNVAEIERYHARTTNP